MSKAVVDECQLPEKTVRKSSQFGTTLHRQAPGADDPTPACPEADRPCAEFTDVETAAYPTYGPYRNPECFGREWR